MSTKSIGALFEELVGIMDELREKCPWDKKQTVQSLRPLTLEETYELADAITEENWQGIKEELGDLLLHIVFYAKIGSEKKEFDLAHVIETINKKLVHRHPHIWGNVQVENEDDVKRNWEKLKLAEGKTSVLSGVPKTLPAMVKATRIQEKAKQVGFEWEHKDQVWEKVEEETAELMQALATKNEAAIEEEFGDLLFSLVNYARFIGVDPEAALAKTNFKFIWRFQQMEAAATAEGKALQTMTLAEMDELWNQIKKKSG